MNQTKDFLLHLDDTNCERFHMVHDVVKLSEKYNVINPHLFESYGKTHLSRLVGWDVKSKEMTKICGYI